MINHFQESGIHQANELEVQGQKKKKKKKTFQDVLGLLN